MSGGPDFERDVFHLGDCAQMDLLPDEGIDLVVAGPPYWNAIDYGAFAAGSSHRWRSDEPYERFLERLGEWFAEVHRVLRPGRFCAVNIGTLRRGGRTWPLPFHAVAVLEAVGFSFEWEIVWHKPAGGRRSARNFYRSPWAGSFVPNNVTEYILVFRKDPHVEFAPRSQLLADEENALVTDEVFRKEVANNVWHVQPVTGGEGHPCPFPPELPLRLIALLSLKGETVLDPFMGSGTTARAARKLERRFVGYEAQPEFVARARRAIESPLATRRSLVLGLETRPAWPPTAAVSTGDLP